MHGKACKSKRDVSQPCEISVFLVSYIHKLLRAYINSNDTKIFIYYMNSICLMKFGRFLKLRRRAHRKYQTVVINRCDLIKYGFRNKNAHYSVVFWQKANSSIASSKTLCHIRTKLSPRAGEKNWQHI